MDCVYSIKLIEKALKMHCLRPGEIYVACFPASLVVKVRCMFLTAKSLAKNRSPVIMFPTWAYSPSESLLENTLEFMVSSFLSFPWHFFQTGSYYVVLAVLEWNSLCMPYFASLVLRLKVCVPTPGMGFFLIFP